jgi:hypothetical protein
MHREGWVGHGEVFLPTLLFHGGYRILDFGGNGPYVREGDKGRFYTEEDTPSVPLRKNLEGSLVEGTHRFRPIFTEVGPLKDKIYHPIKSKIWVEFETKIANIDQELAKRSTMINEDKRLLTEAEERLNAIHNSKLWRLSIIFAKLFRVLAPSESSRYKAIRMVVKPIAKTFFKMR